MWGWVGVGAEYSKGLEACVQTSSCSIAEITVLVFGVFMFSFCLGVSSQLLVGHWGGRQRVFSRYASLERSRSRHHIGLEALSELAA